MDFCSQLCVFMGYTPDHKGYNCLHIPTGRTYISLDVRFNEAHFPFMTLSSSSPSLGSLLLFTRSFDLAVSIVSSGLISSTPEPIEHPIPISPLGPLQPPSSSQLPESSPQHNPNSSPTASPSQSSIVSPSPPPSRPVASHPMITRSKSLIHRPL